jgi:hypothetical protein
MPQNHTNIEKLIDAAFARAMQAHGIAASQIDSATLTNEVLAEIARASAQADSEKLGGYSRAEFDALPPEQRMAIAAESETPKYWSAKSTPTTSAGDVAAHAGMSVADFEKLSPVRKLELQNELAMKQAGY